MKRPVSSQENAASEMHADTYSVSYIQRAIMTMTDDMGDVSLVGIRGDEDSWQFTYMDVITLLFAAFVVLLALYGNQVSKQQELLEGMKAKTNAQLHKAIGLAPTTREQTADPARTTREQIINPLTPLEQSTDPSPKAPEQSTDPAPKTREQSALSAISQRVVAQGLGDSVTVEPQPGGLIITMKETLLFPSGKAILSTRGAAWIREIAPALRSDAALISVEGHTDNVPISTEKFPSNWELSAGRASSVVRELVAAGIPSDKLRAIGYADSRPIGYNAFPSGREQNRRVQIKLNFSGSEEK